MSNKEADLESAAACFWAKSPDADGRWLSVGRHLADAAGVARRLWATWLPESVHRVIAADVGAEFAERVAVFLAAAHDVGKCSGAFSSQRPELAIAAEDAGFTSPVYGPERRDAPHGLVGAVALTMWFEDRHGWPASDADNWAAVLAGHHGTFPPASAIEPCEMQMDREALSWERARFAVLDAVAELSGLGEADFGELADRPLSQQAQAVLTGFVIVCDWIASNEHFFPYVAGAPDRVERALAALDLPGPWRPQPPQGDGDLFAARFTLPPGAAPRPVQLAAVERARAVDGPSLILIEAPTGEGKTEAALAAAEILAERFGCGGVTVALPTCATSDAMFSRVLGWLGRAVGDGGRASAMLCHSRAQFNRENRGLLDGAAGIRGIDPGQPGSPDVEAHWWLRSRKKSALADFTVGTIDQILFASLKSRHVMLRHLGLAGKVVVLDEIHAADEYMSAYLERTLEWLGVLGVPVVALSATLPPQRRSQLLASYRSGRRHAADARAPRIGEEGLDAAAAETGYPMIAAIGAGEPSIDLPARSGRSVTVAYDMAAEDDVVTLLRDALADGGCAAVVRNTVARAQETYGRLRDIYGDDVFLLHSRFTGRDRQAREEALLGMLGPDGERPERLIVVATQVIEQSLDVDFDVMVSDLAPMDLMIQRIGRLHRHAGRVRPEAVAEPRLHVTGVARPVRADGEAGAGDVEEPAGPPEFPRGCSLVYGDALLLRTTGALDAHAREHGPRITSPDDVTALVRATYAAGAEPPAGWEDAWEEAERRRHAADAEARAKAETFRIRPPADDNLFGWNAASTSEEIRGRAQVRDIEDSLEVVLVDGSTGRLRMLPAEPGGIGEYVDLDAGIDDDLAMAVARCTVGLPAWCLRGEAMDLVIDELERLGVPAWQNSAWLRGMLPMPLDADGVFRCAGRTFRYDRETGLHVDIDDG
ncbi:CRISPR-associated helicase Cas3' [Corynebacterium sp.]|uniref:CRISPR-associated helicase Cas3' n=1 Tax=Corynebacterium sp. TaxID=1720 RepID=UPI0026DD036D|nr:CRISPR-associated helicase Cas3' [Corynebacterium sp.]MDO4610393.1 CRISPR-associated helicase Cas3' [Corynebacterium sp.]